MNRPLSRASATLYLRGRRCGYHSAGIAPNETLVLENGGAVGNAAAGTTAVPGTRVHSGAGVDGAAFINGGVFGSDSDRYGWEMCSYADARQLVADCGWPAVLIDGTVYFDRDNEVSNRPNKKAEKQKLIDKEKTRAPQGTPTRRVGQ